jgi:PLP dependent protein
VRERLRFHLIGHLQSNKAARAAELFDGIDSLDSVRLAERLDEAAGRYGKRLPVLIEVKLSPEADEDRSWSRSRTRQRNCSNACPTS